MINIDTDILKQLSSAAKSANEELESASQILNQITTHRDWGCRERVTINAAIEENRKRMRALKEASNSFTAALSQVSEEFVQTESGIGEMFERVEELLGKIISIPAQTVAASAGSVQPSIPVSDFSQVAAGLDEAGSR